MKRRLLSLLLVFAMVLTMLPATAMASELDGQTPAETEDETIDDAAAQVDDRAAADAVIELIDAIDEVTLESETAIQAARTAYDALTDEQKTLVTTETLEVLTGAEAALAALQTTANREAAAAVTDQINALPGEITLESEEAIVAARAAYTALTVDQKALVAEETLTKLTTAEAALANLKNRAAAEAVDVKIEAIGTVTLSSKSAIADARTAYDGLTEEQKALVNNYEVLTDAEKVLAELKAEQKVATDQTAADAVIALIAGIGEVTLESETAITEARAAYVGLTEDQKMLVTNYEALAAAEEALSQLAAEPAGEESIEEEPTTVGTGVTIETGHVAENLADLYLSVITIQGVSGTVSGDGTRWEVELDANTDMTQPLTFELTASIFSPAMAAKRYLWVNDRVSDKSLADFSADNGGALKGTVTVEPEWDNGQFIVKVGVGTNQKLNGTEYTIELSVAGQVQEDPNEIELEEEKDSKYFVKTMTVEGPTVTASSVTDTAFSGSSDHKATVNITLAGDAELAFKLALKFMNSEGAYIAVNGGDKTEFVDGVYTADIDLTQKQQYTFVTYSGKNSSIVRGTYTVNFSVEGMDLNDAPELTVGREVNVTLDQYATGTLDLSTVFTDPNRDTLTYWVSVGGNEEQQIDGSVYTFDTDEACDVTLAFYAKDYSKTSPAYTVNLHVDAIKRHTITTNEMGGIHLGYIESFFVDNITVTEHKITKFADGERNVAVLLTGADDNAQFALKHKNAEGRDPGAITYTPSAEDNQITLENGRAEVTVSTSGNSMDSTKFTYRFYFTNKANTAPALQSGVEQTATADILAGGTYELNLASVFTDANNDVLRYTVQIGNGDVETLDSAEYNLTESVPGTYKLIFRAQDVWGETVNYTVTLTVGNSTETYGVTVNVPSGVTPTFYPTTGYNADSEDIFEPGSALTAAAGTEENGYVPYTVQVPTNITTISFRDDTWGGMSIPVSANTAVTLEKFSGIIDYQISGSYVTADQALFRVKDNDGNFAVSGSNGVDSDGKTFYRFLLAATGNDATYILSTLGKGDLASVYSENIVSAFALEPGGETEKALTMTVAGALTVTVPEGAEFKLFRQQNNYNTKEVTPVSKDTSGGTTTYVFNHPGTNVTWRASYPGKITKAGYIESRQTELNVTWSGNDPSQNVQVGNDVSSELAQRHDASAVVNVNSQNHLVLNQGDNFRLRGYRWWQIIDTDANNIMIEPDFHYNVVTGDDVISINAKDGGNASGNWMDITANKTGTAVVEVGFDAINVSGTSYIDNFTFGACAPDRTALVVVSVGENTADVDFGISHSYKYSSWDAEFSTLYFLEQQGSLTFAPNTAGTVSVSHDKGKTWQPLTGTDGTYTAPIVPGNNILRIETASGTDYQVVRGAQVSVTVREQGGNNNNVVEAGETIRITLEGLHHNISKMSGIYNPGYGGGVNVYYVAMKDDTRIETVHTNHSQYRVATGVKFTIPEDALEGDVFTLTSGYLDVSGPGSGPGAHRDIDDGGVGTNTSAGTGGYAHGNLPEITITVGAAGAANQAPVANSGAPTTATRELGQSYSINPAALFTDPDGDSMTYTAAVDGGESAAVTGNFVYKPEAAGRYVLTFTASDGEYTALHIITLTVAAPDVPESQLSFNMDGQEIAGYVTVSFEDKGVRPAGVTSLYFQEPLGQIIEPVEVPYAQGDSVAKVTLRLLDALNIGYKHSGTVSSGFYLSAIKNFEVDDTPYESMGEFDAGSGSGWMVTLNGTFINRGASDFTVSDDDAIKWQYTCQLGADIGDNYSEQAVKDVESLINAIGTVTLEKEDEIIAARAAYTALTALQQNQVENYETLTAAETALANLKANEADKAAADAVKEKIAAIGNVTLDSEAAINEARAAYAALTDTQKALVENYEVLTAAEETLEELKVNKAAADTVIGKINAIGTVTLESEGAITAARNAYDILTEAQQALVSNYVTLTAAEAKLNELKQAADDQSRAQAVINLINNIGTVTLENEGAITAARTAYNTLTDAQKELVSNYATLTAAEAALIALKNETSELDEIYAETAETLLNGNVMTGSISGEWLMFGLSRAGETIPASMLEDYYAALDTYLAESYNKSTGRLNANKATENERVALALKALGKDPTSYKGYDLMYALEDTAWVTKQGNNSTAFALLVINAANYSASNETALVNDLLSKQLSNGGWNITSGAADADTTAMAVQALAPYYRSNSNVKNAVDQALAYLAGLMTNAGILDDTSDIYAPSLETVAQTIVALTELGRNPAADNQFTKNGKTLLDGLASFYVEDGFCHDTNDKRFDQMSTEQAFYAMTAYFRLVNGQPSLYSMTDVQRYEVKVTSAANGTVTPSKTSAAAGETITVTVTPNTGYKLKSLTMNGEALRVESGTASFRMPARQATLTAVFEKSETLIEQVTKENADGSVSAEITDAAVDAAIEAVKDQTSTEERVITIIPTGTGSADKVEVKLPAASVGEIADVADAKLTVQAPAATVEIPNEILEQIEGSAEETITVTVEEQDHDHIKDENITEDTTGAVIVEVTITKGGDEITNFGTNKLTISIPVPSAFAAGRTYDVVVISDNRANDTLKGDCKTLNGQRVVQVKINHLSTFVVLNPEIQNVAYDMENLDVSNASKETYDAIEKIRVAYSKLSAAEKASISDAYTDFQGKVEGFQDYLKEDIDDAKADLRYFFNSLDRNSFSAKKWAEIQNYYDQSLTKLDKARYTEEVVELKEIALEQLKKLSAGDMTVTFRLIGDFQHDNGVTGHDEYVTWIPTTEYKLKAGATMYDVFMQAMDDNGLSQRGADRNYVESIKAPSVLGGYWLGEFDNGVNSGWMYTVNGVHPGTGLKTYDLKDGDVIVWHYVDDYVQEERTPSSRYYYRWLEADDITPAAYCNKVLGKILTVGKNGTASPNLTMAHIGQNVTFTFTPDNGYKVKDVIVDGVSMGSITSYTYKDLRIDSRIVVEFAKKVNVSFMDVDVKDWFYEDVAFVVENELFEGTGNSLFSPDSSMTRAMLVTVLYRLEDEPAVYGTTSFGDVRSNQYYTDAVTWATRNGIIEGYDNGLFGTNDNVTREQMAAILYRYAAYKGYDVSDSNSLYQYSDTAKISGYAVKAMKWANAESLITGRTSSTLAPQGTATRAEVAAIFHRFVENIVG